MHLTAGSINDNVYLSKFLFNFFVVLIDCMFRCVPQHGRILLQSCKMYTFELMYGLNSFLKLEAECNGNYYAPLLIQSANRSSAFLLS